MSNVLAVVKWLLIAIIVTALVFPKMAVLMLAIALTGTILLVYAAGRAQERNLMIVAEAVKELGRLGYLHSQQTVHHEQEIGRLMQNAGLSPLEFKPKQWPVEGGATQQAKTDF